MSEGLTVDHDVLEGSAGALARIAQQLGRADADREAIRGVLGHRGLAEAMGEFTGNWDRYRRDLVEELRGVSGGLRAVSEAWRRQDIALAEGLDVETITDGSGFPAEESR
jgi:hypothetical protein